MNNFDSNMYNADETFETVSNSKSVISRGKVKLVEINGEQISIVDPLLVAQLESTIRALQHKVSVLEHEMRQLKTKVQQTNRTLSAAVRELDNKVSYE